MSHPNEKGLEASSSHNVAIPVENGHAHSVAVLDVEPGGEDCLPQALDHLRRPMAIDLLKSLFRRTTSGQHRLFDLHVALDGSHAADAARHLDRPSCVSLGSH